MRDCLHSLSNSRGVAVCVWIWVRVKVLVAELPWGLYSHTVTIILYIWKWNNLREGKGNKKRGKASKMKNSSLNTAVVTHPSIYLCVQGEGGSSCQRVINNNMGDLSIFVNFLKTLVVLSLKHSYHVNCQYCTKGKVEKKFSLFVWVGFKICICM